MVPRSLLVILLAGVAALADGHVQAGDVYTVETIISKHVVSHMAVDGTILLISDPSKHVILVWDAQKDDFTLLAGQYGLNGSEDGSLAHATFHRPEGLCVDPNGTIYVVDAGNALIRRIDRRTGSVSTVAGHGKGNTDGDGPSAKFSDGMMAVVCQADGSILVADKSNAAVRRVRPPDGGWPTPPPPQQHGWKHLAVYGCMAAVAVVVVVAALTLSQGVRARLLAARTRNYGAPEPPYQRLPELEDDSHAATPSVGGAAVGNLLSLEDDDDADLNVTAAPADSVQPVDDVRLDVKHL